MIRDAPPKHPASSKWYSFRWSETELNGATVDASTWTLPAGITAQAELRSGYLVGVRLVGGTLDDDYDITNQITTSTGEILHETIRIRIRNSGH